MLHIAKKTTDHLTAYRERLENSSVERELEAQGLICPLSKATVWHTRCLERLLKKLCEGILPQFGILHFENVMRGDLYDEFLYQ